MLIGGLAIGVVVLAGVLVFALASRGSDRAGAEKRFFDAHRVALATASRTNEDLVAAMRKASESSKVVPSELASATQQGGQALQTLALPSATGRFEAASQRLGSAVEAEKAFVLSLNALSSRKPIELDERVVKRVGDSWETAARALAAAYADNPSLQGPPLSSWTSSVEDFATAAVATGERARVNAVALEEIDRYRSQVDPILSRYEELRTKLGDYDARKKTVTSSEDYAQITGFLTGAADGRFELADQLDSVTPPSAFSSLHAGLVGTIRRLAASVRSATTAVSEASCFSTYATTTLACMPLGDTVTYKQYVEASTALAEEFSRSKTAWTDKLAQESQRLS